MYLMFNITQNLRRVITLFFSFLIVVVVSLFYFVGEKKAYETIEEVWADYPTPDDYFFNEDEL